MQGGLRFDMAIQFRYYLVSLSFLPFILNSTNDNGLYYCADPDCKEFISRGKTLLNYIGKTEKHLSFKQNEDIMILSKPVDVSVPDWIGTVRRKVGFVPKSMVREDQMGKYATKVQYKLDELLLKFFPNYNLSGPMTTSDTSENYDNTLAHVSNLDQHHEKPVVSSSGTGTPELPVSADQPDLSYQSVVVNEPLTSDPSDTTNQSVTTDQLGTSDLPYGSDQQVISDQPLNLDQQTTPDQPDTLDKTANLDQPDDTTTDKTATVPPDQLVNPDLPPVVPNPSVPQDEIVSSDHTVIPEFPDTQDQYTALNSLATQNQSIALDQEVTSYPPFSSDSPATSDKLVNSDSPDTPENPLANQPISPEQTSTPDQLYITDSPSSTDQLFSSDQPFNSDSPSLDSSSSPDKPFTPDSQGTPDLPVISDSPDTPDQSLPSDQPYSLDSSSILDQPLPSEQVFSSDSSSIPDQPFTSDTPFNSDSPSATDKLFASDLPLSSDSPSATEKPYASDLPFHSDISDSPSDLYQHYQHLASGQSLDSELPSAADQPFTTDTPLNKDPPSFADQFFDSNQALKSDDPSTPDQPFTQNQSTSPDQPVVSGHVANPDEPLTSDQSTTSDPIISDYQSFIPNQSQSPDQGDQPMIPDQAFISEEPIPHQPANSEESAQDKLSSLLQSFTSDQPVSSDQSVTPEQTVTSHDHKDHLHVISEETSSFFLVVKHLSSTLLTFLPEHLQDTILDVDDALVFTGIIALTIVSICVPYFLIEGFFSVRPLKKKVVELNKSLWKVSTAFENQQEEFEDYKKKALAYDEDKKRVEQLEYELVLVQKLEAKHKDQIQKLQKELKTHKELTTEMQSFLDKEAEKKKKNLEEKEKLKITISSLKQALRRTTDEFHEAQEVCSAAKVELELSAQNNEILQSKSDMLEKEVVELKSVLHNEIEKRRISENEKEDLMSAKTALEKELTELKSICLKYEETVSNLDAEVSLKENELMALKETLGDDSPLVDIAETKALLTSAERDAKSLQSRVDALTLENSTLLLNLKEKTNSLSEAESERDEVSNRLKVLEAWFKEKEEELRKAVERYEAEKNIRGKDKDDLVAMIEDKSAEIVNLNARLSALKDEYEETKQQHKNEIRALETKSHENWLSLCQAERKAQDARKEAELLRQRLTSLSKEKDDEVNGDVPMYPIITPDMVPLPLPEDGAPFYSLGEGFLPPPPLPLDGEREPHRPAPLGRLSPTYSNSDMEDSLSPIRHGGGREYSEDESSSDSESPHRPSPRGSGGYYSSDRERRRGELEDRRRRHSPEPRTSSPLSNHNHGVNL